jgi:hypothetical protein
VITSCRSERRVVAREGQRTSRSSRTPRRSGRRSKRRGNSRRKTGFRSRSSICARSRRSDDEAIQTTVRKTNRALVVHEDTRTGGIAGEITARINETSFAWLDAPVLRVTAHDVPLPYAPQLEDFVLPQTTDIVRAARTVAAY